MTDSAEKKEQPDELPKEDAADRTAEKVLDHCINAYETIRVVQGMMKGPTDAYGALYVALKTLRMQFPHLITKFEVIEKVLDISLGGEPGKALIQGVADHMRKQPPPVKVVDAIIIVPKFKLGDVAISDGVKRAVGPERLGKCLTQFGEGDWGPFLNYDEKRRNDENIDKLEGKLYGTYRIDELKEDGPENKFYIITDADRSRTHIILPTGQ